MSRIGQHIGGIYYKSPIVVASSPLTDRLDLIKQAEEYGAGAVSTKLTIIKAPVKGVRRMYAERGLYTFNPSDKRNELEEGVELVRQAKEQTGIVIWTNISGFGDDIDSWIHIAKAMEDVGADALELNFNCPNMSVTESAVSGKKFGGAVSGDPELMREIITSLKKAIKIPIWVKTLFEGHAMMAYSKVIEQAGADGLTINGGMLGAPPIDIFNKGFPKLPGVLNCGFGGTVGPGARPLSNRLVATIKQMTDKISIAGGGGIVDYKHVIESIMFGSTLTTMCSKILWEGFKTIKIMNEQIEKFMEDQGYETLEDMRGVALRHLVPASDKLQYTFSVPAVDASKCTGCGTCERIGHCSAISVKDKKAEINSDKCEKCGLCVSMCPHGVIKY